QASKHYLVQCGTMRSSDKETLQEKTENLEKAFAKVEAKLEKGPYFKGETLSNIDIAWLPLLYRADNVERHSGYDFFDPFPKVKAWQREVLKTGLAKKSVSEDFVEAFSKFYLSDETYLGRRLKDVSPVGKNKTISGCC
ncbi:MAG: glutathione S-transferase domain-containing protein, partial [Sneathiella sp.]